MSSPINRIVTDLAKQLGSILTLFIRAWNYLFKRPVNMHLLLNHLFLDGIKSIPVIFLMAVFTGGVLTLQTFFGMQRVGTEIFTGSIVGISLTKELIPVLGGLVLAGRVCASYSAEIGTMIVTEQVDALITFGINPVKYLISPRLAAMIIMTPLLTLFGDFVGIWSGRIVVDLVCHQNPNLFQAELFGNLDLWDFFYGMIKSTFFGMVIAIIGGYFGMTTSGGAKGVGRSTTMAVVIASTTILISDFLWSKILPFTLR